MPLDPPLSLLSEEQDVSPKSGIKTEIKMSKTRNCIQSPLLPGDIANVRPKKLPIRRVDPNVAKNQGLAGDPLIRRDVPVFPEILFEVSFNREVFGPFNNL